MSELGEYNMFEIGVSLFLFVVVGLISIPLHELSHLIVIKLIQRDDAKLKITWFNPKAFSDKYGVFGEVKGRIDVSDFWKNHYKFSFFVIGFSGGFGAAVFLTFFVYILILFQFPMYVLKPISLVAGLQFSYAFLEGFGLIGGSEIKILK